MGQLMKLYKHEIKQLIVSHSILKMVCKYFLKIFIVLAVWNDCIKYNKVSINLLLAIGRYDFHIYAIYAIVGKGNEISTYLYKTGRQDNN